MTIAQLPRIESVEYWFDPVCPWAWMTSRWMAEINERLDLNVQWLPFSLKILNERADEGSRKDSHDRGFLLGQVLIHVQEQHGNEAVGRLYTELGKRLHVAGRSDTEAVLKEALAAANLDVTYADAPHQHGDTSAAKLRESTIRGIDAVGPGVGIPIIAVNGNAFFGPVVSPAPKGDDALMLWTALVASTQTPGFFELKRGRDVGPDFS